MDKIRIQAKRTDIVGTVRFWKEIQAKLDEGYRICLEDDRATAPHFAGYPTVWLVHGEKEAAPAEPKIANPLEDTPAPEPEPELTEAEKVLQDLEGRTKKAELLEFAEKHSIEIPEDAVQPSAIKKFLKEALQ